MSDSFVLELPLKTRPQDEQALEKRMEAGRHLYNACLGESLRRLQLCRTSKSWKKARKLSKIKGKKSEAGTLFKQVRQQYQFDEYSIHSYVGEIRKACWLSQHIDSTTAQKIATTAFKAADSYAFSQRGKPRFKGKGRQRSLEGKSNKSGMRFLDNHLVWGIKGQEKLVIPVKLDPKDRDAVQKHALDCKTKYCRVLWKVIRGKKRWYLQVVKEGKPLQKKKHSIRAGIVGLDIGPSSIAAISDQTAFLQEFCPSVQDFSKEIAATQRKMSRSMRLNNPGNFDEKGAVIKGAKTWKFSKNFQKLRKEAQEKQRRMAEARKCEQGKLANEVLAMGKDIRLEKLSYKSLQKHFGRSVKKRSPATFVCILRRKAESAGGSVEEFSPYKTCLSQVCQCGKKKKKTLSERWHDCACGVSAQRDLYSAFLSRFVEKDCLDRSQAQESWTAAEPLLERALSRCRQQAKSRPLLASFGIRRQSLSHAKEVRSSFEALDVVGTCS